MCELLVGCLGKIDQEAIGAAMESVTQEIAAGWVDALGPTPCHCFEKAWSIFKLSALYRQSVGQHHLSQSQSICLYLSAFKTN